MLEGWLIYMKQKKIFNVFFREKPAMMLVTLLNKNSNNNSIYASNLAKVVDCTYSHVVKILQEMEKAGLVDFKKQGRLKVLALTKKGIEAAGYIDKMNNLL
jgi:predicted transcriptional regulator